MGTSARTIRYQIDEMMGDELVASHAVNGHDPVDALEQIVAGPFIERGQHLRWYRVVDEASASVFEYSVPS
ncbi:MULTISPECIES: hypothetical protein [unclassified Mesorhizobium]|uniref:hypothetical protein n=1 Tax=unclassified Mesorhizobium TaxID=325217 RepID=UPI000FD2390F|nr:MULTISPECIES: hypothetical protein [unclassified Mesorhizobium]RUW53367.1 hypothetical protein EOA36_10790 [Mesorhizobium sp. M8A.F.Ca.ET.021.01.1.1]RUX06365.1 hypothetical protein EOA30_10535 [Mesorhizobium sp. M8A.F.Ca.ET.059.01.1.1]TGT89565.1 hypothetical protein EN804_11770 [Mesorhizobium sp. M8A.F.Ca.ET.161.01.1.1]TGV42123.1 hypothetical protein EN785_11760 [Mesorhizobium sp. M8A.F.Ca.ET.142.01.1.1]